MAVDFNTFMQRQAFGGVQPMQTPTGQASPVAPNANAASDRNQRLGLMLFALGGALRGDEDFVQKTIQIQQMQEGKKKEQAEQEKYDDFVRKLPDGTFKDLALAVGKQGLNQLLFEKYKSEQPKPLDPSKAIKREEYDVVMALKENDGNIDDLTEYQKVIFDNFILRNDSQSILESLGIKLGNENLPNEVDLIIKEIKDN
tara:strand:- start:86 stop:685 length:600 start_codon:yes stop_codon:yes gene_type:complete